MEYETVPFENLEGIEAFKHAMWYLDTDKLSTLVEKYSPETVYQLHDDIKIDILTWTLVQLSWSAADNGKKTLHSLDFRSTVSYSIVYS